MNNVWAVLNKIPSFELGLKLSDQLRERDVNVIGTINYDEDVFLTSLEGRPLGESKAKKDVAEIIDFLLDGKDNA